jgi:hypothetical protein
MSLARHSAAIAWAAPQVVAHRLARMAFAGPMPSARDRREFARMSAEKVGAFYESWNAMLAQTWRIQQEMWLASLRAMWLPWQARAIDPARRMQALHGATTRILAKGLAPIGKRAVANAKRLGRASGRRGAPRV